MTTIAVLAPGAMGAAIGRRLVDHGATVLTNLDGRGPASRHRAEEAGMQAASMEAIAGADILLSIVPPGAALALMDEMAPVLARSRRKPVVVDANAISPQTAARVAGALAETGCPVVDACIIGAPPKADGRGPAFYVSGDADGLTAPLATHGLDLKSLDAPFGAAKALKMSYAICTKGVTALAAGMLLGATRNDAAEALHEELRRSQPEFLARCAKAMPDMLPKAARWVAEMREIAILLGPDDPTAMMLEGAARLYEQLAADGAGAGVLDETLLRTFTNVQF